MKDLIPLDSKSSKLSSGHIDFSIRPEYNASKPTAHSLQNKYLGYWFSIFKINVVPVESNVFVLAFLVVMEMNYSLG